MGIGGLLVPYLRDAVVSQINFGLESVSKLFTKGNDVEHISRLNLFSLVAFWVESKRVLQTFVERELKRAFKNLHEFVLHFCGDRQDRFTRHGWAVWFCPGQLHTACHEFVKTASTLLKERCVNRLQLPLCIEALWKILHVGVLGFLVYTAHLHEISAFVVKETHDVLENIFA